MGLVEGLSELFLINCWDGIEETFEELGVRAKSGELRIPSNDELTHFLDSFPKRDYVILDVSLDDGDPISIHSDEHADQFISDLKDIVAVKDTDSELSVKFVVVKDIDTDNKCTIYSVDSLTQTLVNQSILGLLLIFKKLLQNRDYILFNLVEDIESFNTNSLYFSHNKFELENKIIERNNQLKKRNEVCNFLNASEYEFIPEDFYFKEKSPNKKLNELMNMLTGIISLSFIGDISYIKDDSLYCTINGYKKIENCIIKKNFKQIISDTLYGIYDWIYTGGGISDKIGLARNIISIDVKNNDIGTLNSKIIYSLKSGYEIYLKKNIDQYISIKNKLSELIFDISNKTSKKVESFVDSFKKNFLGLFTFFVTIFLRSFLSNDTSPVFTKDVSYIELILLVISLAFLIASIWENICDIKRIKKEYYRLKNRYADLLDENDLENIFNHDIEHLEDIRSVTKKIIIWATVWLTSLIINCILVCCLGQF